MNAARGGSVGRLVLAATLMGAPFLGGCVSGAALKARCSTLEEQIESVEEAAKRCAEREVAMAKAHLEFARMELEHGAYFRGRDHLDTAVEYYRKAQDSSQAPGCKSSRDRDGDGIPDNVDLCPDVAEDIDGYKDDDGCPDDQDTDGDGIPDSKDQCPKEPEDVDGDRDEDGCPDVVDDRDGDGIPDMRDQCIDQPEDKDGFQDDDGCPDPDNDQDGVGDARDKCPLQPEDKDGFEDEDGCPDPDNDQDRIADADDQCPNEPEDYDGDADDDGCPDIYKSIIVRDDRIELKQTVYFASGKARILAKSYPLLNEVALALRDLPNLVVRIEGHTDSQGGARFNMKLSEDRANSVRRYLVDQGIDPGRLLAEGHGEERPIEDNRTAAGRAANRRVEFYIVRK